MSTDLTVPEARTERDRLADRVDVLKKVKDLRALPGDMYLTSQMVADYYGVPNEAIRQAVKRHHDEFESDGYRTVTRHTVSEITSLTWAELGFSAQSHTMALFTIRGVLRLGMLLRDSLVARQVRDMLLDVERGDPEQKWVMPQTYAEALRALATEVEAHEITARRATELGDKVVKDEPKVAYHDTFVESDDLLSFRTLAASLGMAESALRQLLLDRRWIYGQNERNGSRRRYSAYANKSAYFTPQQNHDLPKFNGESMHTLKVTPAGAEAIKRLVKRATA